MFKSIVTKYSHDWIKTQEKIKNVSKISQFYCKICNFLTTDQTGLEMHVAGKWHSENKLKLVNFSTNNN